MRKHRVVITGMGAVSPYGEGVAALSHGLANNICALTVLPIHNVGGLTCHVAGRVPDMAVKRIQRELRRSMSPMSIYACLAAWEALGQAGFDHTKPQPRMGVAIGSTLGSPQSLQDFFAEYLSQNSMESIRSTLFFKVMGHSVASNVALACGCTGRQIAPAAACASGLLSMGLGYESIALGREALMLCGGADEFHLLTAATFDRMVAASHAVNPALASLPFDMRRSGVVCSEGAGVVLLENLEHAQARNAPILAEIHGFAAQNTPNMAQPDVESIYSCMQEALDHAALRPQEVCCINAHATATEQGDKAEGRAIEKLFGGTVPVVAFKGHIGHTMAASGVLESIGSIAMITAGILWPVWGLQQPDPDCGNITYVQKPMGCGVVNAPFRPLLKNAFALGGSVCSLVLDTFTP